MTKPLIARDELEGLYADYCAALDDGEFERWPSFFAEACSYLVTTRENVEQGWPIALLNCESRGMIVDRTIAIQKTLYYLPRMQRRIVTGVRATGVGPAGTLVRASFALFETMVGEHTKVLATGRSNDVVAHEGGALKFVKRVVVVDASLVPNSLPFPI
jgi:salicylate 5-hydroxylase small subunit